MLQVKRMHRFKPAKHFSLFALIIGSSCLGVYSLAHEAESHIKDTSAPKNSRKSFVSNALEQSGPAVVTIETRRKIHSTHINIFPQNLLLEPYLERLFDKSKKSPKQFRIQKNQGSGFIISAKGLVLTNAHVIENTDELIIGLSDGRRTKGKVIGKDGFTDLAIIRLNGIGPWPVAPIGNSDDLIVGDWAIAVGNPYGLEKTVTLGIISNLNRNVSQLGITHKRIRLIQTDAAINPGNSGGPLLNSEGKVIGINTLIRTGPGAGLGFAIPINEAIKIANELVLNGKVIHPMIGVSITYLSEQDKEDNSIVNGAKIIHISPNSPSEKEGLQINDIIIKVNSKIINVPEDVVNEVNSNGIDKYLELTILRNKKRMLFSMKPISIYSMKMK